MADHERFLQLLAKEISRGSVRFSFDKLKTYLLEAVTVLPDGSLKDVLQKQSKENADHLWNLIKPAKKCSVEIVLNFFNKDGSEATLNKISQHPSYKEQTQYLSQAALSYPCNKIYELLLTAQKNECPDQHQHEVLRKVTELYGRLTVGCQNSEVLNGLMRVFLSEIDKINDKFKTSNEGNESWLNFKDIIHRFLIHCHIKRKIQGKGTCKDEIKSKEWAEYRDILAAIIATYIDVIIVSGEINADVNNHISNIVYLLLGDSPSHILDTVNQIFTLDSNTINIVFPFLRKVFETTRTCTTECANYIKYVCLAWKVQHCAREKEMMFLKKSACSLSPPENLLSWLTDADNSLIQDFGLSGLVGQKITGKILQCEDEENIERMLDLASSPEKWSQMTEDLDQKNEEDEMDENETHDPLFFVDAQGSSELLERCQEEEFTGSTNDKMLKTQISALLEKREEAGSEDEKDDFDINLDDNENEATFEFDFVDSEPKNNDEIVPSQSVQPGEASYDGTDDGIQPDSGRDDGRDDGMQPDDGTERVSEGENVMAIVTSPQEKENLAQSGKKRRKRKSKSATPVSEEEGVKRSKKKILKKRRSLLKSA